MGKIQLVDAVGQEPRSLRPPGGSQVWIAIDVSRTKLAFSIRWDGAERRRLSTPLGLEHVRGVVEQYAQCQVHVGYEACGFGYQIAWWLRQQGIATTVIAPSRIERAPGLQVKTDRLDAAKMAYKLERGDLKGIYVPTQRLHQDRAFGRCYAQCLKERKRAQVRIRSLMQEHAFYGPAPVQGWKTYRDWLEGQVLPDSIKACVRVHLRLREDAELLAKGLRLKLAMLADSEPYRAVIEELQKQSGVGQFSAIQLALELGDIDRFRTTDSLPHYLGLTPSQYMSGRVDHRGPTLKCGPRALRALLLQCAWAAVRARKGDLMATFERLAPRIGRKRAIVAVARRLAIKMRRRWWDVVHPPLESADTL